MTDIATRVYNHTWKIDPDRPLGAGHGLLQAADGADDLSPPPRRPGHLRHPQPHNVGQARAADRHRRAQGAARPHPHAVALARRIDLAARQHVLRQAADVRARLHRLARGLPLPGLPPRAPRRPVRADLRGPVDRDHHVGDPGARRADGAAQPRRHQGAGQVRAAGALCARHDARVGEDRAPQAAARVSASPTSARAAATASCGRTGACRP